MNESGKTTVLEALDYFTPGNEVLDPRQLDGRIRADENDLIPASLRTNFNGQVIVRAGVELDDADAEWLRKALKKEVGYKLKEVSRSFAVADTYTFEASKFVRRNSHWVGFTGQGRKPRQRKDWKLDPRSESKDVWGAAVRLVQQRLPSIWYFPNFLFEFPARIYLAERAVDTPRDKFYRSVVQDILDSLGNDLGLEKHLLARARSGESADERSLRTLLLDMGGSLTREVFKAWDQIFRRDVSGKRVEFSVHRDEAGDHYLELQIVDNGSLFYLSERSLGFRWFFVFLLLTTYRGQRKGSESIVYLFDEPASNLHPRAQASLLASLGRLTDRATIVYTTHSHHLINPDWLENTFVVVNRGLDPSVVEQDDYTNRQTQITLERYRSFAAQHPDQSQYFQPILDKLDYAPSRLEMVPGVIMTEGKNDFYSLRYMGTVGLGGAFDGLHFLPGGGAGSLDEVIRLYLGWARNFVVLLDADSEGEVQRRRYESIFGAILAGRVVTLADVAGSGVERGSLEAAFTKADRILIQQSVDPEATAYSKQAFNRAVQEALAAGRQFNLSESTKQRFSSILGELRKRLDTPQRST